MELRTAILHTSSSLPPRLPTLKPAADFAPPFSLFITNSLRPSCFTFTVNCKDQQHFFPAAAGAHDTRIVLNCVGEGLLCTGTSGADCSNDVPSGGDEKRDDNDGTGFLDNYQMIRDCDKLIEDFLVDRPTLTDWRRLLVLNKSWSNIRIHFFSYCQDRADSEDNLLMKKKLLWLGKKLKEIDEDIKRHNELMEMIKRTQSEISEIVSRSRKDFTKEFFVHLNTMAESNNDNPKVQNDLVKLRNKCLAAVKVYDAATKSFEAVNAAELNFQDIINSPLDASFSMIGNLAKKSQCFNPELVAHWLRLCCDVEEVGRLLEIG
ncbi:pentatricopeptide repeat-containing protein [Sesbania bispinosa]|nr:pentatricopeptide repeat-containing protein [Sesbania bispinosa]